MRQCVFERAERSVFQNVTGNVANEQVADARIEDVLGRDAPADVGCDRGDDAAASELR
jgi:hypothetical protein